MERRLSQRVKIERPCIVTGQYSDIFCEGETRNLGRGGALIKLSGGVAFAAGEEVEIEIQLDRNPGFAPKCIHGRGAIVRVENGTSAPPLVAVEFHNVAFRQARFTGPQADTAIYTS